MLYRLDVEYKGMMVARGWREGTVCEVGQESIRCATWLPACKASATVTFSSKAGLHHFDFRGELLAKGYLFLAPGSFHVVVFQSSV